MNERGEVKENFEYYRGGEFPAGGIEDPSKAHESTAPQASSGVEGAGGEDERVNEERETQLELWMENVKAFIRQIDVTTL